MREPETAAVNYMPMYGRPTAHQRYNHHQAQHQTARPAMALPFQSATGQMMSDRGYSRGPLISNEEAESQQVSPIILMLNIPYKDQTPAAAHMMLMGSNQAQSFAHPAIESSIQPILMPYAATSTPARPNPFYKQREPVYTSPFAHHKNHNHNTNYYQPAPQPPHRHPTERYYTPAAHHPYNMMQSMNRAVPQASLAQRYNHRLTNTIEVPIEIHHQVNPSSAVSNQPQAQIIVQPQLEAQSQPNESNDQDQSGENEHHMVVFYSDADNVNHSEENPAANPPAVDQQQQQQQQQQAVFVKEKSKQINNDLEKANQISKMLLLHFVGDSNPNSPSQNQSPVEVAAEQQQQAPPSPPQNIKPFLVSSQQEQPEKAQPAASKLEEMIIPNKPIVNQNSNKPNKPEMIKNEETSSNDQMNRDEMMFEKSDALLNNPNESETEQPASLAHFAQVIRQQLHVIDQQQNQQQEQQRSTIQPQPPTAASIPEQSAIQSSINQNFQLPSRKDQIENSNKETEKPQESVQSPPAFMLVHDGELEN